MPRMKSFEDNQGTVQLAQSSFTNGTLENIDVWHYLLGELMLTCEIVAIHFSSEYEHTECLTKPLSKDIPEFHREFCMNLSLLPRI